MELGGEEKTQVNELAAVNESPPFQRAVCHIAEELVLKQSIETQERQELSQQMVELFNN